MDSSKLPRPAERDQRDGIGQHISREGAPGDTGQKTLRHPADLGKAAVPTSAPDADINTQTGVERGPNDPTRR
jgi:hypothetical protein